ncbi:LysR family transcriptional regulator [Vibrio sp. HN007]|uniref:LysR family transcriptional regulator n=1 Tax=Vibrio iocasae TaxID=3098914 RepID=UPI0035D3F3C8
MSLDKLSRIDLNLLVCLHVLLEHNSVSKAAEQLNLSQSAISKSLARLRELFDDPLLERSGYGMEPTVRAKQIQPELVNLLFNVEKLTSPSKFEPKHSTRSFRMAVVESIYPLIFPSFIGDALAQAPGITIDNSNWDYDTFDQLHRGTLDFAITGKDLHPKDSEMTLHPPKGIVSHELFQDELCCIVNPAHALPEKSWNLDAYLASRHIVTKYYKNERWLLDFKLGDKGLKRDVAIYVPDFNSAAELCCHTNLMLTVPSRLAQHVAKRFGLKTMPLPFSIPPLSYTLFWHENRSKDLAHSWLKELIISRCKSLTF